MRGPHQHADYGRPHGEEVDHERGDAGDQHQSVRDTQERPDQERAKEDEAGGEQLLGPHVYRDAPPPVAPRDLRRATPVRMAASETAGTTRLSNIEGVMYSSPSSSRVTIAASACAAASFISSFTRRARTSSIPRKNPGKQHE